MSDNSEDTGSPPPPHMGGHPGQPSVQYPNDVMGQMPIEQQRMVSDGHPGGGQGLPPHQAAFQRPYLDCNNKPPQDVA